MLMCLILSAAVSSPLVVDDTGLSVDAAGIDAVRTGAGPIHLRDMPLSLHEHVDLSLERFTVTTPGTRFVIGHGQRPMARSVQPLLLRGTVDGMPGSSVFLAFTDRGAIGLLDRGADHALLALTALDGRRGLSGTGLAWHPVEPGGFPPLNIPVCGLTGADRSMGGDPVEDPGHRLSLELAVETDWEFATLFQHDLDAAADYVTALYGAIAWIYDRDVDTGMNLVWVRLWDTEDDLFNEDNPIGPFREHWNQEMGDVQRDLAQFLTGRVNLPYGGVAYLNATCGGSGYSVAGYILGSFVSVTDPAFGNWDITVAAHELGHNCGTGHTHDYGLDECAWGQIRRGSIMSYCHTTTGGGANIDMRFHTVTTAAMRQHLVTAACLVIDCNANGAADSTDILDGTSLDANLDGVPDECQDCNGNGVFDDIDIADSTSLDVDGDGIPDECEPDCNGNGMPDHQDIADGTSTDDYGDGVPDECEQDCNGNSQSDYAEIQDDMDLDRNRNAVLDSCEDCDGDGTPDLDQLGGGLNLWVLSGDDRRATAFHPLTGVPMVVTAPDIVGDAGALAVSPGGRVFVSDLLAPAVIEIDSVTGESLGAFIGPEQGICPGAMDFVPSGDMVIADICSGEVHVFDIATGDVLMTVPGGTVMEIPRSIHVTPAGALLVADQLGEIREYDLSSGELVGIVVASGTGGVTPAWYGLTTHSDGFLLVSDDASNGIHAFDPETGLHLGRWETGGLADGYWQLQSPRTLQVGPGGKVLVATSSGNTAVQSYHPDTGLFQRSFYVLAQMSPGTTSFAFMPPADIDCNGNLRPDSCDIADGTSPDANGNGVPDSCECVGDLTGDGAVDVDDVLALIAAWGTDQGDANGDGTTDVNDVLVVLEAWGQC